jgi:hypothetical protein
MLASALTNSIRAIFLHREPYVTKKEAAELLGWTVAQLKIAIAAGEVATVDTCGGVRIPLSEVATMARERWQPVLIEQALGADAPAILPPALWTRAIAVRLSRYHVAVLGYFAKKEGVPIDAILARHLDELMSAHSEELVGVLDDFDIALNWPQPDDIEARA